MSDAYRVLITGSRTWDDREAIEFDLAGLALLHPEGVIVVHGACPKGADAMADAAARRLGLAVERHAADWNTHGKAAGFRRNQEMVDLGAHVCLAYFALCTKHPCPVEGAHVSHGAADCARRAERAAIPVRRRVA